MVASTSFCGASADTQIPKFVWNAQVLQDPDLTNKVVGVFLRFREEQVARMGDVEAIYHQ